VQSECARKKTVCEWRVTCRTTFWEGGFLTRLDTQFLRRLIPKREIIPKLNSRLAKSVHHDGLRVIQESLCTNC
jgi:hypothetical protein